LPKEDGINGCDGMFEEYVNFHVKLRVLVGEELLTFTGLVKEANKNNIKLFDKFGKQHIFKTEDIKQLTKWVSE